jgi:hypothetical protein
VIMLRDLFCTGFSVQRVTVSSCSESRWALELHGVNSGIPMDADVRLRTTLGARRKAHAQFWLAVAQS